MQNRNGMQSIKDERKIENRTMSAVAKFTEEFFDEIKDQNNTLENKIKTNIEKIIKNRIVSDITNINTSSIYKIFAQLLNEILCLTSKRYEALFAVQVNDQELEIYIKSDSDWIKKKELFYKLLPDHLRGKTSDRITNLLGEYKLYRTLDSQYMTDHFKNSSHIVTKGLYQNPSSFEFETKPSNFNVITIDIGAEYIYRYIVNHLLYKKYKGSLHLFNRWSFLKFIRSLSEASYSDIKEMGMNSMIPQSVNKLLQNDFSDDIFDAEYSEDDVRKIILLKHIKKDPTHPQSWSTVKDLYNSFVAGINACYAEAIKNTQSFMYKERDVKDEYSEKKDINLIFK